jgi:peptidoglycan hydrolase-like protein with peptidoglycan-binding domain
MRPIRSGDRGPAVEDVQRRLLLLGYDLGPTGVDGVLLGDTLAAIARFQADRGLPTDGVVGDKTWAAIVDATFTFGDRTLYLRIPHFHGRDVLVLQQALSVLGFPSDPDGIFGRGTDQALREFQLNVGLPPDGIVGPETADVLQNLRHLWEGKQAHVLASKERGQAANARVLERSLIDVRPEDAASEELAARISNLAFALTDAAQLGLLARGEAPATDAEVLVRLAGGGTDVAVPGVPLVLVGGEKIDALASRMRTALATSTSRPREVLVTVPSGAQDDEREAQQAAVVLLDALCAALE